MENQVPIGSPTAAAGPLAASSPGPGVGSQARRLGPTPYQVVAHWEYRRPGDVQRTSISRHFTVSSEPHGPDQLVTLLATPPQLRPPDLTALEELTGQLAALYQRLVVRVAPTGQLLELLNHADLLRTWARLEPELTARFGGGEPNGLTARVLGAVGQQVPHPADVLASLGHDYAYGFLLHTLPAGPGAGDQPQVFPHFFADTPIYFRTQATPLPSPAPGQVSYRLLGLLEELLTDRAAAARQVAAELAPEADPLPPPPAPDNLAFAYQATYVVDVATGWPTHVEATVSCQGPAGYAKEYHLTIAQL